MTGKEVVYTLTQQLRASLSKASNPEPDGPEVTKFIKALKNSAGKSVTDIAKATNLTDREVKEILGETGGWWG